jgi:hypothetical protein
MDNSCCSQPSPTTTIDTSRRLLERPGSMHQIRAAARQRCFNLKHASPMGRSFARSRRARYRSNVRHRHLTGPNGRANLSSVSAEPGSRTNPWSRSDDPRFTCPPRRQQRPCDRKHVVMGEARRLAGSDFRSFFKVVTGDGVVFRFRVCLPTSAARDPITTHFGLDVFAAPGKKVLRQSRSPRSLARGSRHAHVRRVWPRRTGSLEPSKVHLKRSQACPCQMN